MFSADEILQARELRTMQVLKLAKTSDVLTIKANVPGENKNLPQSYVLVGLFANLAKPFTKGKAMLLECADGPCLVYEATVGAKIKAVELEETHPLGRFVDIDVYPCGSQKSLSRGKMRKCYVCSNPAFVCGRTHVHTTEQLVSALSDAATNYVSDLLLSAIDDAILTELNLENKFGLVTPTSSGSHADMNYQTMLAAAKAIEPYVVQSFWIGATCGSDELLKFVRPCGISAEQAMLKATDGVNAYKGLIFVATLLTAAAGRAVSTGRPVSESYKIVQKSTLGITDELSSAQTFGGIAFRKYGITGARGQAEQGFPAVQFAQNLLACGISPLQTLCEIVGQTDDTVLLKRSGSRERYDYFRKLISDTDVSDSAKLLQTNRECLQGNVSIGGSADILVAAVLQKNLSNIFCFDVK